MPELPEVEAARRAIEENCLGKKIKRSVVAADPKVIDGVSPSDFEAALTGKTIVAAHRKGKNMWIQLDSPPFPSFQFGMAGAIYIKGVAIAKYKRSAVSDTDEWPSKYSKLFIELDDGLELSFTDKRRFAKVRLLENPASATPICELGPDALLEPMTEDELFKSLNKKKIGIKALLLDQSFISGVGNWIADEVLYQARIHPLQSAASVSKERCAALHNSLKEVIGKAVEVGADSSQFPSNWIFHSREKKPGKAFVDGLAPDPCNAKKVFAVLLSEKFEGKKIEFINAGGRTTAYVPELQKLSGDQAAKASAKPQKRSTKIKDDEDSDDADEPQSEDEEIAKSAKPKTGKNTTQSSAKKPPAKRKSSKGEDGSADANDDDDVGDQVVETKDVKEPHTRKKSKESNEVDEDQKGIRGNKRPPARKKSQETDNNSGGGDEIEEDERVQAKGKKEVAKKIKSGRQTKKRGK